MRKIPPKKAASAADTQNLKKALAESGGGPVAVTDRGRVTGYLVPQAGAGVTYFEYSDRAEIKRLLEENKDKHQPVLDYLKSR